MSFTYDLGTDVGQVRLLIPDNDSASYELQDEEIAYFLAQAGGSVRTAAVQCCLWLARKYAKQATFSADGLSFQASQRAQVFAERAKELQAESFGWGEVTLDKEDGYASAAAASEYTRGDRPIYIEP